MLIASNLLEGAPRHLKKNLPTEHKGIHEGCQLPVVLAAQQNRLPFACLIDAVHPYFKDLIDDYFRSTESNVKNAGW